MKVILITFLVALVCFAVSACRQKTVAQKKQASDQGIHKTTERGPVKLILGVDKKQINIAQRLHLSIDIRIEEDYDIKLPSIGEKLDQFGIVDYHTSAPRLIADNRKQIIRTYVLEPMLSGDYVISPMKFTFWEKGEKDAAPHTFETEALTIKVVSLLPEDISKMKLNDIQPPVNPPRSYKIWIIAGIVVLSLLLCGMLFAIIWYRRKQHLAESDAQRVPAHLLAYASIEQLIARNLPESGEIKLFYQEVSQILRQYIENRFGFRAPEQTTEEFLSGLQRDNTLIDSHKNLLSTFLRHCDLVKFAEHQPQTADIQNTFDSCKNFIEETKVEGAD